MVAFDDGSSSDLSSDSRVSYSTADWSVRHDVGVKRVSIVSGAACTSVLVVATVQLGAFTFVVNHTRPVVFLPPSGLTVTFSGYPDTSANRGWLSPPSAWCRVCHQCTSTRQQR